MNKLPVLITVAALLAACQATMNDPDDTVATFSLYADSLEALISKECVDRYGSPQECTPYPNEMECDTMQIAVKADGRTMVDCVKGGKLTHSGFASVGDGVPFMCKANADMSCVLCVDIYGNTAHDTCNRGAQLYRGLQSGFQQNMPEGSGYLTEPGGGDDTTPGGDDTTPGGDDTTPGGDTPPSTDTTPPSSGGGKCDVSNAFMLYAKELNKLLAHEGLNFSWTPDTSKMADPSKGFFGSNGNGASGITCDAFAASIKSKLHKCAVQKNGQCYYCWEGGIGGFLGGLFGLGSKSGKTCRCYRINVAAIKAACAAVPPECDKKAWSGALIMSYGVANKWLFSPSYNNFYGQVTPPAGDVPKFPKCKGSPLVLDLGGDGIQPTSAGEGVKFDLLGFGELQTAWVKGDDALLALDRDDNGRIDNGTELFGEATAGLPHEDGFEALAELDSNQDGKLDAADARFSKLVLWQDRNGDGMSQKSELSSLKQAGIKSLAVGGTRGDRITDLHGNDLSLRGGFTRTNGSTGLMVDVYFSTGK